MGKIFLSHITTFVKQAKQYLDIRSTGTERDGDKVYGEKRIQRDRDLVEGPKRPMCHWVCRVTLVMDLCELRDNMIKDIGYG